MVTLPEAIAVLYPQARPLTDYRVEAMADGGQSISYWSPALGPPPTAGELAAVTVGQVAAARTTRLRDLAVAALDGDPGGPVMIARAELLELLDYENRTRAEHNRLLTWLGGQTTLTNRAALAGFQLVEATAAQARDAVKARMRAGQAD